MAERAQQIAAEICARAGPDSNGGLRQAYDGGTDAAVLLAPMLGFPLPRGALLRTIDRVRQVLGRGDFLARYVGEDGLAGGEGEFLVCTSWLIDAELACGRHEQARASIERLVNCANDVGLYAEEVDASSGAFLGNFPQALTHLGVIGNVVNLQLVERHGTQALHGSYAESCAASGDGYVRLARRVGGDAAVGTRGPRFLLEALQTCVALAEVRYMFARGPAIQHAEPGD